MSLIDRSRVRNAFHRQAGSYEQKALVQKRVIMKIAHKLRQESNRMKPGRILDVGSGTGMLLKAVGNIFPQSTLAGVDLAPGMGQTALRALNGNLGAFFIEGDAEHLPFADSSFDLVLSTSTFQWLNVLDYAFNEVFRVLAPGGKFIFALFGERTLWELRAAHAKALQRCGRTIEDRTHRFFTSEQACCAMKKAGFLPGCVMSEMELEYHDDVAALLRSLRDIGAGNASGSPLRGIAGRKVMLDMMEIYRAEFGNYEGIPATYEVLYGEGQKAEMSR